MGNTFLGLKKLTINITALILVIAVVSSCVPSTGGNARTRVAAASSGSVNVPVGQGRVLLDNPAILSKNTSLSTSADLNKYATTVSITTNPFLQGNINCYGMTYCFEVRETELSSSALQTADGKWGFAPATTQFLQVNTFYHMNKMFNQFFSNLGITLGGAYDPFSARYYDTAIPLAIRNGNGTFNLDSETLVAAADCNVVDNAYYEQTSHSLCFGYSGSGTTKSLRWAHDSTIIYHEVGHFFQKMQLNLRNLLPTTPKADLGSSVYTEAGAIGEGLSDFFSFYINGRTHWGEWAGGKLSASRPLSESDPVHSPGNSTDEDQRLSYPQYLNYDPNAPTENFEDVHVSGMILSHYLVALTQDIQSKCSYTPAASREYVMSMVTETLAELGDLTSQGTEGGAPTKINLDATNAFLWMHTINPINYRSFTQTMAKNLLNTVGNPILSRCNGSYYQRDYIEALLDSYGLLLFKTYNQHRNLSDVSPANTSVTPTNRKKSILISKNNIILDPTTGASSAYVIDNRAQIVNGIAQLQASGLILDISETTDAGYAFNNSNSKVSPGEIVAIALNLYNNSNSTMGGVEVLASDWDHANKTVGATKGRPCKFSTAMSNDQWPLETEGGSLDANCSTTETTTADFAPVCFIQLNEASSTKWVSQNEFRSKIAVDSNLCLDKTKPNECFIRAIKGADKSYYSKINPKATWGQTMANPETGAPIELEWGNVMLFEVSKHVPPGTIVDCRLRVRFTNCEDCYHDSTRNNNDYLDKEYNGPRPFKVIHLQIPITD